MLNNKNFRLLRHIVPPLWDYSAAEMVRFTVTSVFDITVIVKQPHSDNTPYEKIDDEVHPLDTPFDIPESWEWVRHNDLFEISGGSQPPKSKFISEARDGYIRLYQIRDYGNNPVPVYIPISAASKISHKGDILLARYGASLGKVFWAEDGAYNVAMARVIPLYETELISKEFLFLFYQSSLYQSVIHANSRSAQAGFNKEDLSCLLFPLPPRSEQERIVCAYEKLQPFLNAYDDAAHSLATMNKDFPEALKKSILQEAVQGKLVPQDPSDEPAEALLKRIRAEKQRLIKEGKIKKDKHESVIFRRDNSHYEKLDGVERCIDDELPFDIPESWIWVRLIDICEYIQRGKSPKYSPIKKYPVIAQKCNQWSGFSIEKAQFIEPESIASYGNERFLQDNDLMWNSTGLGTLGRMAVYKSAMNPYDLAVADSHVTVVRPLKEFISPQYIYYYFSNPTVQSVIEDQADGTTKQKELSATTVKAYYVPLPPYNEQLRIVNQIEAVLPLVVQA